MKASPSKSKVAVQSPVKASPSRSKVAVPSRIRTRGSECPALIQGLSCQAFHDLVVLAVFAKVRIHVICAGRFTHEGTPRVWGLRLIGFRAWGLRFRA